MTVIVRHRINSLEDLSIIEKSFGIEVDVRSKNGELVMAHDPFSDSHTLFHDWLESYDHNLLIVNLKEEGLESKIIAQLNASGVSNYFFLDQSFPFLIKWSKLGERHCAVRVSEFESIETALSLAGKIDWVWVDCFTKFPLVGIDAKRLQDAGFKLCLVSPELQGRPADTAIPELAKLLNERHITADAICTKNPELWKECL
jgi:hypothetical protein